ncbi:MAG: G5 domain-containing protein [Oscillibacter sp.]|nr:G5 domain-containing protein [Oscillibacter sp.]
MNSRKQRGRRPWSWLHHVVTLSAALVVLFSALSAAGWVNADALYILTGVEDKAIVLKEDAYVSALASKQVYLTETGSSRDVILTEGQDVTIRHGDEVMTVVSQQERVSALLDRMHVEMSPLEMISIQVKDENNVEVVISEELTYYDRETEPAPHGTVRVPSDKIPVGTEQVVQEGKDGERTCVYEVTWSGGEMLSRQLVEEATNNTVDQIVEYGVEPEPEPEPEPAPIPEPDPEPVVTVPENNSSLPMDKLVEVKKNSNGGGTLVFQSGRVVKFKAIRNMTATAYNKNEPKVGTITASGTKVHKGVVAVDRRVIKLGTKMYIVASGGYEYGYSVAEDTGVSGNVIDLYFESYSGMQKFGRRSCTVYILE